MYCKKSRLIKIISTLVVVTFCLQNITWANPDLFREDKPVNTLQVQSGFKPLLNPQVHHEFLLRTYIIGAIKHFKGLENLEKRHLFPIVNGMKLDLRFDKKYRDKEEGNRIVIPCLISYEDYRLEYEAVIDPTDPENSLILRRPVAEDALEKVDWKDDEVIGNIVFAEEFIRRALKMFGQDVLRGVVRSIIGIGKYDPEKAKELLDLAWNVRNDQIRNIREEILSGVDEIYEFAPEKALEIVLTGLKESEEWARRIAGRHIGVIFKRNELLARRMLEYPDIRKLALSGVMEIFKYDKDLAEAILLEYGEEQLHSESVTIDKAIGHVFEYDWKMAEGLLEKMINISPDYGVSKRVKNLFKHNPKKAEMLVEQLMNNDVYVSARITGVECLQELFDHNPVKAEKLLLEAKEGQKQEYAFRREIVKAAGWLYPHNPEKAEEIIREALNRDSEPLLGLGAVDAIAEILRHDMSKGEELLKIAFNQPVRTVMEKAGESILYVFDYDPEKAEELLDYILTSGRPEAKRGAVHAIKGLYPYDRDKAERLLEDALTEPDGAGCHNLARHVETMIKFNHPRAEESFKRAITHPDEAKRWSSLDLIGVMFGCNPKLAEEMLVRAMKDDAWRVRHRVSGNIMLLFDHNPRLAIQLLKNHFNQPEEIIGGGAVESMEGLYKVLSRRAAAVSDRLRKEKPFLADEVDTTMINTLEHVARICGRKLEKSDIDRYKRFAGLVEEKVLSREDMRAQKIPLVILSYIYQDMPHWEEEILSDKRRFRKILAFISDFILENYDGLSAKINQIKVEGRDLLFIYMDIYRFLIKERQDLLAMLIDSKHGKPYHLKGEEVPHLEREKELGIFFINTFAKNKISRSLFDIIIKTPDWDNAKDVKRFFRYISLINVFPEEYMDEYEPIIKEGKINLADERRKLIRILTEKLKVFLGLTDKEEGILADSLEEHQDYWHQDKFYERILIQAAFFSIKGREALKEFVLTLAGGEDALCLNEERRYQRLSDEGLDKEFIINWKSEREYYIGLPQPEKVSIKYDTFLDNILGHLGMEEEDLLMLSTTYRERIGIEQTVRALQNIISFLRNNKEPDSGDVHNALMFVSSSEARDIFIDRELINDLRNLLPKRIDPEILKKTPNVRITADPRIFMRAGLEPYPTCQRPTGATSHNEDAQLINRIMNGQFKIAQYLLGNTVVARTHLELTKNEANMPVLLVENIYEHPNIPYDRDLFEQEIFKYAVLTGIGEVYWAVKPEKLEYEEKKSPDPLEMYELVYRDNSEFNYLTKMPDDDTGDVDDEGTGSGTGVYASMFGGGLFSEYSDRLRRNWGKKKKRRPGRHGSGDRKARGPGGELFALNDKVRDKWNRIRIRLEDRIGIARFTATYKRVADSVGYYHRESLIYSILECFTAYEVVDYWDGIVKLCNITGPDSIQLFQKGIPAYRASLSSDRGIAYTMFREHWPTSLFMAEVLGRTIIDICEPDSDTIEYIQSLQVGTTEQNLTLYEIFRLEYLERERPVYLSGSVKNLVDHVIGLKGRLKRFYGPNYLDWLERHLEFLKLRNEGLDALPHIVKSKLSPERLKEESKVFWTGKFDENKPLHMDWAGRHLRMSMNHMMDMYCILKRQKRW